MKANNSSRIAKLALLVLFAILPIELIADTLIDVVRSGSMDKVKKLIEDGRAVNYKDQDGFTALIASAEMGNRELVKFLITHGADVNATNKYKANALHKVLDAEQPGTKKLSAERIQIAHYLISSGIDVKAKGYNDTTALHLAVFRGDISIIESLIEHGADVKAKTKKGRTPLDIANVLKDQRVLDALNTEKKEADQKPSPENDSAIKESDNKGDTKNEVDYSAYIAVLWGLAAILFYRAAPIFRNLMFVAGILVTIVGAAVIWDEGQMMAAVTIGLILIATVTFTVRFQMLKKK